jgi:hypothetical protein
VGFQKFVGHLLGAKKFCSTAMGKGRAKSFKPEGKDKSRIKQRAASKKTKKADRTGIIHGRVESAKTERKVLPLNFTANLPESQTHWTCNVKQEFSLMLAITNRYEEWN